MGSQPNKQPICNIHKLPAIYINMQINDEKKKYICNQCIQQIQIPQTYSKEEPHELLQQIEQQDRINIQTLNKLMEALLQYKESTNRILNFTLQAINQQILTMGEEQTKLRGQLQQFQTPSLDAIKAEYKGIQEYLKQFQNSLFEQLQNLASVSQCNNLFQILNELNFNSLDQDNQIPQNWVQINSKQIGNENSKFEYALLPQNSYEQNLNCHAIAFNRDSSIIIAGCDTNIKIFEFKGEKLVHVQTLKEHSNWVNCLQFMKKSNHFISGSRDNKIIVWELNRRNEAKVTQILLGHNSTINCFTMNSNEDLIISGSQDKSIMFWPKSNNKFEHTQIINCTSSVWGLSLNDSNTQLISCEEHKIIQVIQLQGQEWTIIQKITLSIQGVRICFLSDFQFAFQPWKEKQVHIYNFNQSRNEYIQAQEVQIKGSKQDWYFFPQIFIQSKGILLAKNCKWLNIIRRQRNGEFVLDQQIEFKSHVFFGTVSHDGQYLITWDEDSKNFHIRTLSQMK